MMDIGIVCVVIELIMQLLLWCADNLDMLEMVGDVDTIVLASLLHNSIVQARYILCMDMMDYIHFPRYPSYWRM